MSVTYLEAIRKALIKILSEDSSAYIYGQDIAEFGGAFKATKGLHSLFPERVIDSPISEDAMVGSSIGAAIEGMRPILEFQFADFSSVGFSQIVNQAATLYYRTGVTCPLIIRMPSGGTRGSGPFHSQNVESIYSHYPGLIVLTPATVDDAYHMLVESSKLNDPIIFCENKFLYYHLKSSSISKDSLPIGKSRVLKFGKHATLISYGGAVHDCLEASNKLKEKGWDIEVLDLRSVKPLDMDTILASVARTGRVLCVSEGFPFSGITSEISSRIVEEGFHLLDAPIKRHNCIDSPIPYSPNLWDKHKPTVKSISESLLDLLKL